MGGFVNGVGGNVSAAGASASDGFGQILAQIASGVSDNLLGAQNGQAQGGLAKKLDQILSKLEDLLAGLNGDKGANQGAQGAQDGKGAQDANEDGHGCDAKKAQSAQKGEASENNDPISQLKKLIKQLEEAGLLKEGQAEKLLEKLDEMQAKQNGGAQGEGVEGSAKSDDAKAAQASEEAKAGEKAGQEDSVIKQLEELIAQLKEKLGDAKAKQGGDCCECAEAENAGSFMDNAGKADYASMVEKNKAA